MNLDARELISIISIDTDIVTVSIDNYRCPGLDTAQHNSIKNNMTNVHFI